MHLRVQELTQNSNFWRVSIAFGNTYSTLEILFQGCCCKIGQYHELLTDYVGSWKLMAKHPKDYIATELDP